MFGYPAVTDAVMQGRMANMYHTLMQYSILIPLLMFASIGFAGAFHTLKMLAWGEGVAVTSTFFKGIKANLVPFLLGTLFLGIGIFVVAMNFALRDIGIQPGFMHVMTSIATIIVVVLLAMMTMYMYTQAVTYKLKLRGILKNSFAFSLGMIFHNIFFLGIVALPVILMLFLPFLISLFFGIYFLFIGISIMILIMTLYTHYVYDRFLNDRADGAIKDRGVYRKSKEEIEAKRMATIERRKIEKKKYSNPKKKKITKGIDEGEILTPLQTTFSRKDIQKLQEEKQKVLVQSEEEDEADETGTDTDADTSETKDNVSDAESKAVREPEENSEEDN
jgi:uncharacterized membrane protein YesL